MQIIPAPLNIEEIDGSPSIFPYKLKVSNATLTDNGDGTATLTVLTTAVLDALYVKIAGDTMTGNLTLPTLYATDSGVSEFNGGIITTNLEATDPGYSVFNGGIIIKSGQKLILDGA